MSGLDMHKNFNPRSHEGSDFANQYDMKDDSGNKVTGCSVHYLFWGENGEALASEAEFDPTKPVGVQRAKCSLDPMFRNKIVVAPGLYEGTFEMVTGSDGKPVNRLRDVAFISHVEIKQKVLPGFYVQGMIQPETAPEARESGKAAK